MHCGSSTRQDPHKTVHELTGVPWPYISLYTSNLTKENMDLDEETQKLWGATLMTTTR